MRICLVQYRCNHFTSGDNKPPNEHVRATIPCRLWVTMDCKVIGALAVVQEHAMDEPMACNLGKVRRIKGK